MPGSQNISESLPWWIGPSKFSRAIMSVAIDRSWKHCSHDQRIQPRRWSSFGWEVSLTRASLQAYVSPTFSYRSPLSLSLHWTWKYHLPFFSSSKQQTSRLSIRNSHAYPYAVNRYGGCSYALNQGIYLNYTLVYSVEGIGWKPFFRVGKPPKFYLEVIIGSQPLVSSKEVEIVDDVCTWKEKLPL